MTQNPGTLTKIAPNPSKEGTLGFVHRHFIAPGSGIGNRLGHTGRLVHRKILAGISHLTGTTEKHDVPSPKTLVCTERIGRDKEEQFSLNSCD